MDQAHKTITMPQLGETVTEGTITRWLKQVGDTIAKYEPFAEVATDKVNAEIPSPVAGILLAIHCAEGETVPTGAVIAEIGLAEAASADARTSESPAPVQAPPSEIAPAMPVAPPAPTPGTDRSFSPAVRRAIRATGVDAAGIRGTGTGGRVTLRDIEHAAQAQTGTQKPETRANEGEVERIPLTRARKMIAAHMVTAKQTIPHAWTMIEVDASTLVALRMHDAERNVRELGFKPTYFHYFAYTLVQTLKRHRLMNARFTPDAIEVFSHIDMAFAIALDGSLVVPVVRGADAMDFAAFATALSDVTHRARTGHLAIDELQGGTITANNTGANGSILSSPIINGGQAAIVTMESIVKRPVVIHDAIAIRSMMNVCCSIDHRAVDGDVVGSFLRDFKLSLERIS